MVLMRMGDQNGFEPVALGLQKSQIGHDDVDAGQLFSGKGYTAIHQQPAAVFLGAKSIQAGIHADFTNTAQRHKNQFVRRRNHIVLKFPFTSQSHCAAGTNRPLRQIFGPALLQAPDVRVGPVSRKFRVGADVPMKS